MATQKRKASPHDDAPKKKVRMHTFISSVGFTDQIQRGRSELPVTNEETTSAACEAVLLTTELLENILLRISPKDLLLDQRVSRKWRDVIARSEKLQEKLFFKPVAVAANKYWQRSECPGLLYKRMDVQTLTPEQLPPEQLRTAIPVPFTQAIEKNPFLTLTSQDINGVLAFQLPAHWMVQFEHGSWRKMYLSTPVAGRLWFYVSESFRPSYARPNDCTIGEIVDACNSLSKDGIDWSKAEFCLVCLVLATMEEVEKGVLPIPEA